jgi:hypothetical protein
MLGGQLDDPVPAFGCADDAPQRRKHFGCEIPRSHAVGSDHEVLNQLFSPVLSFGFQVLELIAIKHRAGFYGFEIKRTVLVPEPFSFGPRGPEAEFRRDRLTADPCGIGPFPSSQAATLL